MKYMMQFLIRTATGEIDMEWDRTHRKRYDLNEGYLDAAKTLRYVVVEWEDGEVN